MEKNQNVGTKSAFTPKKNYEGKLNHFIFDMQILSWQKLERLKKYRGQLFLHIHTYMHALSAALWLFFFFL